MNINELKSMWKEIGFRPNKVLGQNYLVDKNIVNKIIYSIKIKEGDTALEIGPGFGAMTIDLAENCHSLTAVEYDRKAYAVLEEKTRDMANIEIFSGDFLEFDIAKYAGNKKIVIYGNIPYSITTPIIERLIKYRANIKNAYFVLQNEYADRMTANPGTKNYGSLTCFVSFYTECKKMFKIKRGCFFPVPKVDSALIEISIPDEPTVEVKDEEMLFKIIRTAFGQRRKKVSNTLKEYRGLLEKAGIGPDLRAENISLKSYANLANLV